MECGNLFIAPLQRFIYNYKAVMEGESHPLAGVDTKDARTALMTLIRPGFQPDKNPRLVQTVL